MITAEQKLARQKYLGSSEAAAVLGLDPFQSAADVWLIKTGQAEGFSGNEATERGNLLEPALIQYAVNKLGWERAQQNIMHVAGSLACNLDAANVDETEIIEAKTTVLGEDWGEEGTDQIPERVNVQVHHQFFCVPTARVAWVPVLLPGFRSFDWRLYRVEKNDEVCAMVAESGIEFMRRYVAPVVRPTDYKPSLEVLKRVRREPNKTVELDDAILGNFVAARAVAKQAEEMKEISQRELLAALGDAECGTGTAQKVTYMITKRKAYEVAASECRTLRVAKL